MVAIARVGDLSERAAIELRVGPACSDRLEIAGVGRVPRHGDVDTERG